jgi:cation transport ATPase
LHSTRPVRSPKESRYFESLGGLLDNALAQELDAVQDAGKTCVLVGEIGEEQTRILGGLAIADVLRAEAPEVVHALKEIGIERVVMVTGDNSRVASAIAPQASVDEFYAALLPEDKVVYLTRLKQSVLLQWSATPLPLRMKAPAFASCRIYLPLSARPGIFH